MLRCGTALLPVYEEIIQSIRDRIGSDGYITSDVEPMVAGSTFSIQDGSLRGLKGVFERQASDRTRVVILLEGMQSRVRLVIERQVLKPIT